MRPEVTDFIIGSSCDYSFIPEMCPSGNVDAITDSDEYLVIEMQARMHEAKFLRPGPIQVGPLAKSLSEWTTVVHRKNANHSLVFHAEELPPEINRSVEEADAFIADIAKNLSRKPQPYRGHPYWHGAMAAFHEVGGRKLNNEEWIYALGLPETPNKLTNWLLWHSKFALMGKPPHVLPWHPAWPDFQTVIREIDSFFTDPSQRMLLLSNEPTAFSVALADNGERTHRLRCRPFLKNPPERYERLHGKFDLCLLELSETDMEDGGELTDRIVPLLKNGGRIILFVLNRRVVDKGGEFGHSVTFQASRFIRSSAVPTEIHFVPSNALRQWGRSGMSKLRRMMNQDAVADRAADRGLRRLSAAVLFHRQPRCLAVDAARRRTRPFVELRHAAHRRCAQDRHRAGLLAFRGGAREARGNCENGERHAARRHQ